MALPALAFIAYAALLALTILVRPRYRTLAGLLLATAAVLGVTSVWLGNAKEHARAPTLARQAIDALHAQPWPATPQDLARLVASFRALGDKADESAVRFAYARSIERSIAGEPPLTFTTVDEALAWIRALPPHNDKSPEWREVEQVRQRAISTLIDVHFADTSGGWPPSLDKAYALRPGSRLVAPGVWAVDSDPSGRLVTLQYALQARNLGQGRIVQALINYRERALPEQLEPPTPPRAPGAGTRDPRTHEAARLRTFCTVHITNLDPGESSYSKCAIQTSALDTPQAARQLEHVAQLREGAIALDPMPGGSFQYTLTDPPQAEPFSSAHAVEFTEEKKNDAARIRNQRLLNTEVNGWLIVVAVFGAGFALPGIRRRPIGIIGTLVLAVVGAIAVFVCGIFAFTAQGMDKGWVPVISFFVALFCDAVLLGGVLLANLALRMSVSQPPGDAVASQ